MVQTGNNQFVFIFFNEDTEKETEYSFNIIAKTQANFDRLSQIDIGEDDEFNDFVSDQEGEYGVHDVGFNSEASFYGFNSYEVEPKRYEELIDNWRKFFTERGFTLTDTIVKDPNAKPKKSKSP